MSQHDKAGADDTFVEDDARPWESTRVPMPDSAPRITLRGHGANPEASPESVPPSGAGRYEILGEIARGGMGAVLRGKDVELNRDLAVKVLLEHHRDEPDIRRRFLEEAQIGGQLQHPGIVPVYELGKFPDGRPFFAMKLVMGRTLAELLHERPSSGDELPRFLAIFEQVCQTMAYAHSRGVMHRDLKPLNIMVGHFGEVQVMDWGLAKVLDSEFDTAEAARTVIRTVRSGADDGETADGLVLGTPAYMAPEQARGEPLDERADVFGLGAILCEILTGRPPHTGRGVERARQAARGDLSDARARLDASGADAELIALAKACLAADPLDRPRDAGEVARRMTAHLAGVQDRLRAAELARVEAVVRAEAERVRRKLSVALSGSLCVSLLIGGAAWLTLNRFREARIQATDRAIAPVLTRAESLRHMALAHAAHDPAAWDRALEAAAEAREILSDRLARPGLETRVQVLYDAIRLDAERAREQKSRDAADFALAEALDLVCLEHPEEPFVGTASIPRYEATFRDAGLDIAGSTAEAATLALKDRKYTDRIATALDDWAVREVDAIRRDKILFIAHAIDPDPFRGRVRAAVASRDRAALAALASDPEAETSAMSADVLASDLASLGALSDARAILIRAQRLHPADFWINYDLGMLYLLGDPPQPNEATRFLTASAALKVRNPGALIGLGHALDVVGQRDDALALYREALRLKPDFAPARRRLDAAR